MLTIESVKNIKWANEEKTSLIADVKFKEFDDYLPYGINAWDKEKHGIELYTKAKANAYGAIAAYVAPPEPIPLTAQQKLERAGLTVDELKTLLGI